MKRFIVLAFCGILCGSACLTSKPMNVVAAPEFDKQGHRGCRGLMPENTIPAMLHAIDLGVTTLELDVVITKDDKVVLSHEPFFNYEISTKPDGSPVSAAEQKQLNIYKMTYSEVAAFDVGMKHHPKFPRQRKMPVAKPLLEAVIDSVESYIQQKKLPPVYFNIETKSNPLTDNVYHPAPEKFIDLLLDVLDRKGIKDRTIIQSFDVRTLQHLHRKRNDIKTALLIEGNDKRLLDEQLKQLGFLPNIYSPHYSLVTGDLIQQCRQKGLRIIPWTVNEAGKIEELKKLGVDGIISDYPDLFGK